MSPQTYLPLSSTTILWISKTFSYIFCLLSNFWHFHQSLSLQFLKMWRIGMEFSNVLISNALSHAGGISHHKSKLFVNDWCEWQGLVTKIIPSNWSIISRSNGKAVLWTRVFPAIKWSSPLSFIQSTWSSQAPVWTSCVMLLSSVWDNCCHMAQTHARFTASLTRFVQTQPWCEHVGLYTCDSFLLKDTYECDLANKGM